MARMLSFPAPDQGAGSLADVHALARNLYALAKLNPAALYAIARYVALLVTVATSAGDDAP